MRSNAYPDTPFSLFRLKDDELEGGVKPGNGKGVLVETFDALDCVDSRRWGEEGKKPDIIPDCVGPL